MHDETEKVNATICLEVGPVLAQALKDIAKAVLDHFSQQAEVDKLTAQVIELTGKLHKSNSDLQGSTEANT